MRKVYLAYLGVLFVLLLNGPVFAGQYLQLDIFSDDNGFSAATPGDYVDLRTAGVDLDLQEEVTHTRSNNFTLYTLINPNTEYLYTYTNSDGKKAKKKITYADDTFWMSMALVTKNEDGQAVGVENSGDNYGSFSFGSAEYTFSGGAAYGTPPESAVNNNGELIDFTTYYYDFSFTITANGEITIKDSPTSQNGNEIETASFGTVSAYDVTTGAIHPKETETLIYAAFDIDIEALTKGLGIDDKYGIYFDLHTLNGDGSINTFTSSAYDAEIFHSPEPTTLVLLGLGLIGAAGIGRKRYCTVS